jgi:hypothetical protein
LGFWILQTGYFKLEFYRQKIQFKLGKKSSWIFQTGELEKSSADR